MVMKMTEQSWVLSCPIGWLSQFIQPYIDESEENTSSHGGEVDHRSIVDREMRRYGSR